MDHDRAALLDRRPLYPEVVAFGAPRGTRAVLKRTAETAEISVSELIRTTLAGDGTKSPAASAAMGWGQCWNHHGGAEPDCVTDGRKSRR